MDSSITTVELARTIRDAGYNTAMVEEVEKPNNAFVTGRIGFEQLASGMSLHVVDAVENADGKSTSETNEMLSMNFLLTGSVRFAIENKSYRFTAEKQPLIFMSAIKSNQLFSRFFEKGVHVRKINLSVDKAWLLARCHHESDQARINAIFAQDNNVYQWQSNAELASLIAALYEANQGASLTEKLYVEQVAFQLFTQCFKRFTEETQTLATPQSLPDVSLAFTQDSLEHRIEKMIHERLTLTELSKRLGASISTLQRYFKAKHALTLKEYIRNQKLEYARRSLLFESMTIGEAAYFAGYNHVSNFVTAFKRHFAMTPAELKKRYIKGQTPDMPS